MGTASSGRPSVKNQLSVIGNQDPPIMPDDLDGEHARELWASAVESLPHVLRPIDFAVLRTCCDAYQKTVELFRAEDFKQAASMARVFEHLASKLGLHPSSRRIVRPVEDVELDDESDMVAALLKRGGLN